MNKLYEPYPDYECRAGYANAWGYRNGSNVAKLIDYIRDEHRAKYGLDYRLVRLGKNRYKAIPGNDAAYDTKSLRLRTPASRKVLRMIYNDYGVSYAKENAAKFGLTIT